MSPLPCFEAHDICIILSGPFTDEAPRRRQTSEIAIPRGHSRCERFPVLPILTSWKTGLERTQVKAHRRWFNNHPADKQYQVSCSLALQCYYPLMSAHRRRLYPSTSNRELAKTTPCETQRHVLFLQEANAEEKAWFVAKKSHCCCVTKCLGSSCPSLVLRRSKLRCGSALRQISPSLLMPHLCVSFLLQTRPCWVVVCNSLLEPWRSRFHCVPRSAWCFPGLDKTLIVLPLSGRRCSAISSSARED